MTGATRVPDYSRRKVLKALSGGGTGILLSQNAAADKAPTTPAASDNNSEFGDWPLVVTNDWSEVKVESYPTLVIHLTDGLTIFSDGRTYKTTIDNLGTPMQVITTEDAGTETIDQFPTLLIEAGTDDSQGSITLLHEGDI